jgi:CMP-N-acetylneuraminic acid synthetase
MGSLNTVGLIPARAGSSRIKRKNLRSINGKTLIERAVNVGQLLPLSNLLIFTDIPEHSFSNELKGLVMNRSGSNVSEEATADSYLHDFLGRYPGMVDRILLLQPTSPFRNVQLLRELLLRPIKRGEVLASGYQFREQLWISKENSYYPAFDGEPRRQQEREVRLVEDGCFYIIDAHAFKEVGQLAKLEWSFVLNQFPYTLDINEPGDLDLARVIEKSDFYEV